MSFFKSWYSFLICAVMLAPACAKTPQLAVESTVGSAAACDGAVFQGKCVVKGDIVTFGNYPQATNSPEPISWIVLDVVPKSGNEDGKVFLLSQYVLDARSYNGDISNSAWKSCSMRKWLNKDFMNAAFSQDDQSRILTTHLENPANPEFEQSETADPTDDNIFLLSLVEVLDKTDEVAGSGKYFAKNEEREAKATMYAIQHKVQHSGEDCAHLQCSAEWWLRTPGLSDDEAAYVYPDGDIGYEGNRVDGTVGEHGIEVEEQSGIRPALWVRAD